MSTETSVETPDSPRTWRVGSLTYDFRGLVWIFSWLLWGDFAGSVRDRAVPTVMNLLFGRYGASNFLVGVLSSSWPALLSLFIGPVVGYKSDRLRTRWGRRIPFLLAATPFIALSVFGLAFAPELGGMLDRFLGRHSPGTANSVLIVLGILWTIFEISLVTGGAVFNGLLNDVVPQQVIGRFFGLFRIVSLFAGILFFLGLNKVAATHIREIFIGIGLINGIGLTLMCLMVKEGDYPPPPKASGFLKPVITYFKEGFGHAYYLWYFAATILGGLTAAPFNTFSLFYSQSLKVTTSDYFICLGVTYCCSLVLAYPLGWLADRFHPLRTSIVSLVLYAMAMAYGFFFAQTAWLFDIAMVVHGVVPASITPASPRSPNACFPAPSSRKSRPRGELLAASSGSFSRPCSAPSLIIRMTSIAIRSWPDSFSPFSLWALFSFSTPASWPTAVPVAMWLPRRKRATTAPPGFRIPIELPSTRA
jgi:MFS family permease